MIRMMDMASIEHFVARLRARVQQEVRYVMSVYVLRYAQSVLVEMCKIHEYLRVSILSLPICINIISTYMHQCRQYVKRGKSFRALVTEQVDDTK